MTTTDRCSYLGGNQMSISRYAFVVGIVLQFTVSASARSAVIVDTGPGPSTGGPLLIGGPVITQWLAAEFSIGSNQTITDVQGWMGRAVADGTVTATLYTDGGDVPGTELFSQQFQVSSAVPSW